MPSPATIAPKDEFVTLAPSHVIPIVRIRSITTNLAASRFERHRLLDPYQVSSPRVIEHGYKTTHRARRAREEQSMIWSWQRARVVSVGVMLLAVIAGGCLRKVASTTQCPAAGDLACPDGCKNLQADVMNCGSCGHTCPLPSDPHASAVCVAGQCAIACNPSYFAMGDAGVCMQLQFDLSAAGIRTVTQRATASGGLAVDAIGFEGTGDTSTDTTSACSSGICVQGEFSSVSDPGFLPGSQGNLPR